MTAHIVAVGGGGFGASPLGAPTNIDRYMVELTGKRSPLVCFAPTASADDPQYINKFLVAYGTLGVRVMVLTLWQDAARSVDRLAEADLVVVGNGATVNLLALWKAHGVDEALRRRYAAGDDFVIGGVSAGGNAVFQGFVTDSFGQQFRAVRGGLGLVEGSFCCHLDGEDGRVPVYTEAVADGTLPGGYAADDGAGIQFTDGKVVKCIAETSSQRVFRIDPSDSPSSSGVLSEPQRVEVL
ncbi:Type 1 glutamine amidotransferase-like domain-containing protein [Nigerium massiliense]|uniref:Type 1 glutamine amidotransferase-like domain-containing protein n=1 Tax=Nigerium massiliense TaxID=1522317 RepID=UPI00058E834E|nr:Type 1 glutamine amidotransferase-like domain-containing protein [Nigerium massiliense]